MKKVKSRKYEIDMCTGPIFKNMLLFTLPLILSSILQLMFNAVDIIVVGRFAGDDALASVGSSSSLIELLTNLFLGLTIGSNILSSRFYGAKEKDELQETVHTSIALSIISGLSLTVIGVICAPQILSWMNTPPEIRPLASVYLRVYFLGTTATMIYNFGSSILRAIGDTKRPLYYLTIAGILNIVLNLIFVIVFHWGVCGVGISTVISQFFSAIMVIRCLIHEQNELHLDFRKLRIKREKLFQIIKIGLPAGLQSTLFSVSNVVIQSTINSFGTIMVAGDSAANNIVGFVYVGMNAFYHATISFIGQNVGAKNHERINKVLSSAVISVFLVGFFLGNTALFFGRKLLSLYTENSDVIDAGLIRLTFFGRTHFLLGIMNVIAGAIRGLGYSITPMIISLLGACIFRLVWLATIFQIDRFHTIYTVYLSYPISWILTIIAHVTIFYCIQKQLKKKWHI